MNRVIYPCIAAAVILVAGCAPPPANAGTAAGTGDQSISVPPDPRQAVPVNPPPLPSPRQRHPVTPRPVSMDTAPHRELLANLQRELYAGDSATLAARVGPGPSLKVYRAGSFEGGVRLDRNQIQLALDTFFAARSRPSIHGFYQKTSEHSAHVCLGVVTAWWGGTVPLPEPGSYHGESVPSNLPEGWAGWRLCSDDGEETWRWDAWVWGGSRGGGGAISDSEGLVFSWPENESWDQVAVGPAGTRVTEYIVVVPDSEVPRGD